MMKSKKRFRRGLAAFLAVCLFMTSFQGVAWAETEPRDDEDYGVEEYLVDLDFDRLSEGIRKALQEKKDSDALNAVFMSPDDEEVAGIYQNLFDADSENPLYEVEYEFEDGVFSSKTGMQIFVREKSADLYAADEEKVEETTAALPGANGGAGTETPETSQPETSVPETPEETTPETSAPEIPAETTPETSAPETPSETTPETSVPEAPEETTPETNAPETSAETTPETNAPEAAPETGAPEAQAEAPAPAAEAPVADAPAPEAEISGADVPVVEVSLDEVQDIPEAPQAEPESPQAETPEETSAPEETTAAEETTATEETTAAEETSAAESDATQESKGETEIEIIVPDATEPTSAPEVDDAAATEYEITGEEELVFLFKNQSNKDVVFQIRINGFLTEQAYVPSYTTMIGDRQVSTPAPEAGAAGGAGAQAPAEVQPTESQEPSAENPAESEESSEGGSPEAETPSADAPAETDQPPVETEPSSEESQIESGLEVPAETSPQETETQEVTEQQVPEAPAPAEPQEEAPAQEPEAEAIPEEAAVAPENMGSDLSASIIRNEVPRLMSSLEGDFVEEGSGLVENTSEDTVGVVLEPVVEVTETKTKVRFLAVSNEPAVRTAAIVPLAAVMALVKSTVTHEVNLFNYGRDPEKRENQQSRGIYEAFNNAVVQGSTNLANKSWRRFLLDDASYTSKEPNKQTGLVQGLVRDEYVDEKIAYNAALGNVATLFPAEGTATPDNSIFKEIYYGVDFTDAFEKTAAKNTAGETLYTNYVFDASKKRVRTQSKNSAQGTITLKYTDGGGGFWPFNYEGTPGDNNKDYFFGMQYSTDFFLPADGKHENEDPIKFNFTGDDDVWVYIKDANGEAKLALDLGGIHTAVNGTIDFSTGLITYTHSGNAAKYLDLGKDDLQYIHGSNTQRTFYWYLYDKNSLDKALEDNIWGSNITRSDIKKIVDFPRANVGKQYTMDLYYIERNPVEANCKIDYSLPVIQKGSLQIRKEVVGTSTEENDEYSFNVHYSKEEDGPYTLLRTVEVKAGMVKTLTDLEEGWYYVEETNTTANEVKWNREGVDANTSAKVHIAAGESGVVLECTNTYYDGSLTIEKKLSDNKKPEIDFPFTVKIENLSEGVQLKKDGTDVSNEINGGVYEKIVYIQPGDKIVYSGLNKDAQYTIQEGEISPDTGYSSELSPSPDGIKINMGEDSGNEYSIDYDAKKISGSMSVPDDETGTQTTTYYKVKFSNENATTWNEGEDIGEPQAADNVTINGTVDAPTIGKYWVLNGTAYSWENLLAEGTGATNGSWTFGSKTYTDFDELEKALDDDRIGIFRNNRDVSISRNRESNVVTVKLRYTKNLKSWYINNNPYNRYLGLDDFKEALGGLGAKDVSASFDNEWATFTIPYQAGTPGTESRRMTVAELEAKGYEPRSYTTTPGEPGTKTANVIITYTNTLTQIDKPVIKITKVVTGDNAPDSLEDAETYAFALYKFEEGQDSSGNKGYQIYSDNYTADDNATVHTANADNPYGLAADDKYFIVDKAYEGASIEASITLPKTATGRFYIRELNAGTALSTSWQLAGGSDVLSRNSSDFNIADPKTRIEAICTNDYPIQNLIIKKEIDGTLPTKMTDAQFEFEVLLQDSDGKPLVGEKDIIDVNGILSTIEFNADGKATISLKQNESITITDIPIGAQYTIQENLSVSAYYKVDVVEITDDNLPVGREELDKATVQGTFANAAEALKEVQVFKHKTMKVGDVYKLVLLQGNDRPVKECLTAGSFEELVKKMQESEEYQFDKYYISENSDEIEEFNYSRLGSWILFYDGDLYHFNEYFKQVVQDKETEKLSKDGWSVVNVTSTEYQDQYYEDGLNASCITTTFECERASDGDKEIVFTNRVDMLSTDLTIVKKLVEPDMEPATFIFEITNMDQSSPGYGDKFYREITIPAGKTSADSVTISDLPVSKNYVVKELDHMRYKLDSVNPSSGVIDTTTDTSRIVTFTNKKVSTGYFSDSATAVNKVAPNGTGGFKFERHDSGGSAETNNPTQFTVYALLPEKPKTSDFDEEGYDDGESPLFGPNA